MKVFLGRAKGGALVVAEIEFPQEGGKRYFAITGERYSSDFFGEEDGQQRARDSLEDDDFYLWRNAVEAKSTTLSAEDWVEFALDSDGWESIVGDVHYLGGDSYATIDGCGCIEELHGKAKPEFEKLAVKPEVIKLLRTATRKLHLKDAEAIAKSKALTKLMGEVANGLRVLKKFEVEDLLDWGAGA